MSSSSVCLGTDVKPAKSLGPNWFTCSATPSAGHTHLPPCQHLISGFLLVITRTHGHRASNDDSGDAEDEGDQSPLIRTHHCSGCPPVVPDRLQLHHRVLWMATEAALSDCNCCRGSEVASAYITPPKRGFASAFCLMS